MKAVLLRKKVVLIWKECRSEGTIEVINGKLISIKKGSNEVPNGESAYFLNDISRLVLEVEGTIDELTEGTTRITVNSTENPFSFNLNDITDEFPVYIPEYGVAVTVDRDARTYSDIEQDIKAKALKKDIKIIDEESEEDWAKASEATRKLKCMTWLGLSRDVRIFWVGFRGDVSDVKRTWDYIIPRFHNTDVKQPEQPESEEGSFFSLLSGRGMGCMDNVSRWLEDDYLPILKAKVDDGNVKYEITAFAAPEISTFTKERLRGTHYIVADGCSAGHMFTKEQQALYDSIVQKELDGEEQVVLFYRVKAENTSSMPDYAHCCVPVPTKDIGYDEKVVFTFNQSKGYSMYDSGKVYCISKVNGKPLRQEEFSVFLKPGEVVVFDFYVPHSPLEVDRAEKLEEVDFDKRFLECKEFWTTKLGEGARISVPEKRIENMIKAGICHIETVAYGKEPEGSIVPTTGVYTAIGSESAPIIQFMDYMGYHNTASRMLQFFFDKQHDNGFIQNFANYMVETGPVLWTAGEHFRLTKDMDWAKKVSRNLIKACDFIIQWRELNKVDRFKNKGYGMIDGRVGDPEDPYHSFMLNGYAFIGVSRTAEILESIGHIDAKRVRTEAENYRNDIRESFFNTLKNGAVVPLEDGSWCPTVAPWPENSAPLTFHMEGGRWITHGAVVNRDSLIGPLYLAFNEVLGYEEQAVKFMMDYHTRYMLMRNVAFSQPYYCRHDWIHLKRGEVKAFLKTYYNSFAGLADRETYTFWEHYYHISPHKTHEEAWFLMQTRWMLYMEDGNELSILPAVPRAWLKNGKVIEVKGAASYFGRISFMVESKVDEGYIKAQIECEEERLPETLKIRLPHPEKVAARHCEGGKYIAETECVTIDEVKGKMEITLSF